MNPVLLNALIIIIVTITAVVISDRSGLNTKCDGWASPLIGLVGVAVLASLFL